MLKPDPDIQSQILEALSGPPDPRPKYEKTCIVATHAADRELIQRQIADREYSAKTGKASLDHSHPEYYVIAPGAMIAGRRFTNILISDWLYRDLMSEPRMEAWIRESLICRLVPGGHLIRI